MRRPPASTSICNSVPGTIAGGSANWKRPSAFVTVSWRVKSTVTFALSTGAPGRRLTSTKRPTSRGCGDAAAQKPNVSKASAKVRGILLPVLLEDHAEIRHVGLRIDGPLPIAGFPRPHPQRASRRRSGQKHGKLAACVRVGTDTVGFYRGANHGIPLFVNDVATEPYTLRDEDLWWKPHC